MRRNFSLAGIFLLFTMSASAATFVVPPDDVLVEKSSLILEGEVLTSFSRYGSQGRIETVTDVSVGEMLKGILMQDSISIVHPGGRIGDRAMHLPGVPDFSQGDRVLLFLTMNERGQWTTVDLALGKFSYLPDRKGRLLAIREFEEIAGWDLQGNVHEERTRDANRFRRYVRDVATSGRAIEDYYVDVPAEELQSIASMVSTNLVSASDYTFLSDIGGGNFVGWRWNTFSTTDQEFFNRNAQTGITDGGVSALQDALAAWTNDCGSKIEYHYGGVNSAAKGQAESDGVNGVVFGDVFNEITGSFNCTTGGVLGIGGPWSLGTHTYGFETMISISEGNVVIQNGVECWSGLNDGRFTQLLVHELGHTLGFRHSDEVGRSPNTTAAIMRASLVQNLGATLQQYDKDAAASVYSGGGCATIGDLDLDGKADLLWRRTDGKNAVWHMDGFTRLSAATLDAVGDVNWSIVGSGDFDGDGDSDIVWRNGFTGSLVVWMMDGATRASIESLDTVRDLDWTIVSVADFNSDSSADLLWYHTGIGKLVIWYMNGIARDSIATFDQVRDTDWMPMGTSDFEGDGDPDLVWRHQFTGNNVVWSIESGARAAINSIDPVKNTAWSLSAIGDLDGDGDGDIVWRHPNGKNVVWTMDGLTRSSIDETNPVVDATWQIVAPN